jgi:hypothetical protein
MSPQFRRGVNHPARVQKRSALWAALEEQNRSKAAKRLRVAERSNAALIGNTKSVFELTWGTDEALEQRTRLWPYTGEQSDADKA